MSRRNKIGLIAVGLGDWVDPYQAENGKISAPLEVTDSITVYDMAVKAEKLFDAINDDKSKKYVIDVQVELRKP